MTLVPWRRPDELARATARPTRLPPVCLRELAPPDAAAAKGNGGSKGGGQGGGRRSRRGGGRSQPDGVSQGKGEGQPNRAGR
eukprot:3809003-Alexandrium_andersonii.AAC.1